MKVRRSLSNWTGGARTFFVDVVVPVVVALLLVVIMAGAAILGSL
jgi:hypothetical protein